MSSPAQAVYAAGFGPVMVPVTVKGDLFHPPLEGKSMGKAPGVKPNGHWKAIGTPSAVCANAQEAALWESWRANVGIACGREPRTLAIDSDCDDEVISGLIRGVLLLHLPCDAPMRYVASPDHQRHLTPVRIAGEMPKGTTLRFAKGNESFGVDFLGEGKQFVAFGIHAGTGCPYAWTQDVLAQIDGPWVFPEITLETLARIKTDIVDALAQQGWVLTSGKTGTGGTSGTSDAPPPVTNEEELLSWLALTPNTDKDRQFDAYDQFIQMAHAIWGASGGAAWGRDAWLAWCAQRAQEREDEGPRVWDSIKASTLGLDWIKTKARERDPGEAAQQSFDEVPDEADAVSARLRPVWESIKARFVWVGAQGVFIDLKTGVSYPRGSLDLHLGHQRSYLLAELQPGTKGGGPTVSALMAAQPDLVRVDALTYWPGRPKITQDEETGRTLLNSWKAPVFKRRVVTSLDVQIWIAHIEYVTGSKADAELLIKWLALAVQYPDIKASWHPLLMTRPGIGKDSILIPVIVAIGVQNTTSVNATDLSRNWTGYLEHRLVYVSEARQQGGSGEKSAHAVMNEIKEYLSAPPTMVWVERKGRDKYQVANNSMWVFFSNERVPLYFDDGERRIWPIENFAAMPKDRAYYETLHNWFRDQPDAVANYLMDYPLTAQDIAFFKGPPPVTQAKQALVLANADPIRVAVDEVIDEARHGAHFPTLVVDMMDFAAVVERRLPKGRMPNHVVLAAKLREAGAVPAAMDTQGRAQPVRINSTTIKRLWVLASTDEQGRDYSTIRGGKAGKLYHDQKWPTPTQTRTGVPLSVVPDADVV